MPIVRENPTDLKDSNIVLEPEYSHAKGWLTVVRIIQDKGTEDEKVIYLEPRDVFGLAFQLSRIPTDIELEKQ